MSDDISLPMRARRGFWGEEFSRGWGVLGGAFLIYFVSGGLFGSATVFFHALMEEFGWSRGQLSGAFSLGFVVAGLSAPFWGYVADRRGPRASLIPGAFATGVVCVSLSAISGIHSLYALYALFAFGSGGISLIPVGVLLSNWFVEKRGRAIGIAYTGGGFGMLFLTPAAGVLVSAVGWRDSYVVAGLLALVVVVPIAFWLKDHPLRDVKGKTGTPRPGNKTTMPAEGGLSLCGALATPAFWLLALTCVLTQMALAAVYLHQVPLLTDYGLTVELASVAAGVTGGMGILGRVGFGLLAERRSTLELYIACYLMYAAGIALLWATASLGTLSVVLFAVIFGAGAGGSWALGPLLVGELFGVRALGEIFGFLGLAATVGGALGGTGAGFVFDWTGNYDLVLAVCVGLSISGALLMLLVKPPDALRASLAQ